MPHYLTYLRLHLHTKSTPGLNTTSYLTFFNYSKPHFLGNLVDRFSTSKRQNLCVAAQVAQHVPSEPQQMQQPQQAETTKT